MSPAPSHRRTRGATLIEFTLVLLLGVLPLVLAILQIAALLVAHNTVNLATFLAVRQGAMAHAELDAMRRELARGLLPLYVPAARGGRSPPANVARSYATALRDVLVLDDLHIETPTRAQALPLVQVRDGVQVIPNDALEYRGSALQEANMLTIVVTHCQPLVVPFIGPALAAMLAAFDDEAVHLRCYVLGRAPLRARASSVMQSDTRIAMLTD